MASVKNALKDFQNRVGGIKQMPFCSHGIDAASGGSLMNKTADDAKTLISSMAVSAQQTGIRDPRVRKVSEIAQSSSPMTSIEEREFSK